MIDIFHCFFCNKNLLGSKRSKFTENKYFFWCDKKCHDACQAKIEESSRPSREWSAFMCDEGPCPKEMLDEAKTKGIFEEKDLARIGPLTSSANNSATRTVKSSRRGTRTCSNCGCAGHNARTCGRKKSKTLGGISSPHEKETVKRKISKGSRRKQYKCGKCGGLGHNTRTCGT